MGPRICRVNRCATNRWAHLLALAPICRAIWAPKLPHLFKNWFSQQTRNRRNRRASVESGASVHFLQQQTQQMRNLAHLLKMAHLLRVCRLQTRICRVNRRNISLSHARNGHNKKMRTRQKTHPVSFGKITQFDTIRFWRIRIRFLQYFKNILLKKPIYSFVHTRLLCDSLKH